MKNNIPNYNEKVFTDNEIKDIIDSYLNGESSVKIGKRYGISHKTILKTLHKNNVEVSQKKLVRKYTLNENYFDDINTPNKAYILGFLWADGHNGISKSTLTMSLQEEDFEILEKIRHELNSNKPLEYLDYSNKHDFGYHYKNQYRINVFSKHMCMSLENLGMLQNKSLKLKFPNIPETLYRHFIRGYFDGDGSFCGHYTKLNKFQPIVTFTSTNDFCITLQKIIKSNINIPGGNIYDASCKNGITKVLSISGVTQVKTLLDWLYLDADLFLDRKYQKYINAYINNSLSA